MRHEKADLDRFGPLDLASLPRTILRVSMRLVMARPRVRRAPRANEDRRPFRDSKRERRAARNAPGETGTPAGPGTSELAIGAHSLARRNHLSSDTFALSPCFSNESPKLPALMEPNMGGTGGPSFGSPGWPYTVDSMVCHFSFQT